MLCLDMLIRITLTAYISSVDILICGAASLPYPLSLHNAIIWAVSYPIRSFSSANSPFMSFLWCNITIHFDSCFLLLRNEIPLFCAIPAIMYISIWRNCSLVLKLSEEQLNSLNHDGKLGNRILWLISLIIYDKLHSALYDRSVIHADGTPVKIMRIENQKLSNGNKSFIWVYRNHTSQDKNRPYFTTDSLQEKLTIRWISWKASLAS